MVQPQPSPLDIGGSYPWEYCSVDRCQTCRTAFDSEDILATDCRVQCSQCKLCPRATGAARRKCRKFCRNGRKSCNDTCLKGQAICFYCSPICNGLFWRWKINQILQRSNQHNDRLNDPHCYHARLAFWNIIVLPTALENHLETLQASGLDNLCLFTVVKSSWRKIAHQEFTHSTIGSTARWGNFWGQHFNGENDKSMGKFWYFGAKLLSKK